MFVLVLFLIGLEIRQISLCFAFLEPGPFEMFDIPPEANMARMLVWLICAHFIRILVLGTFLIGWRWSFWLIAIAYAIPYVPYGNHPGPMLNSTMTFVFLVPFIAIVLFRERQYLWPWRSSISDSNQDIESAA